MRTGKIQVVRPFDKQISRRRSLFLRSLSLNVIFSTILVSKISKRDKNCKMIFSRHSHPVFIKGFRNCLKNITFKSQIAFTEISVKLDAVSQRNPARCEPKHQSHWNNTQNLRIAYWCEYYHQPFLTLFLIEFSTSVLHQSRESASTHPGPAVSVCSQGISIRLDWVSLPFMNRSTTRQRGNCPWITIWHRDFQEFASALEITTAKGTRNNIKGLPQLWDEFHFRDLGV
jgi:hypothetical protein